MFFSVNRQRKVYDNREWESPYITNNSTFYENDYINIEARTTFHNKTWIPNDVELVN